MTKNAEKVTIYHQDFLGVSKIEARLVEHGTQKYAQYDNAPFVKFVPKRARKVRGFVQTFRPYMLILRGHGHPDLETWKPPRETQSGVMVQEALYSGCDERWNTDADAKLDKYVEVSEAEVLADYRYTKGFNSHNRF